MTEALKTQLIETDPGRSRDALVGVGLSRYQTFAERATVGPFHNGQLDSKTNIDFLSNPKQVLVVGCGRNEHQRGNLIPTLRYSLESTNRAGNLLYVDANSTDGSIDTALSMGVHALRRENVLSNVLTDKKTLAEILAIDERVLNGKDVPGNPPLRKGIDVMVARIALLQMHLEGKAPRYVSYIDTDLKSIPGGSVATRLQSPDQVYYPLQLIAAGVNELNSSFGDKESVWGVYTGSEKRNNEPIFAIYNTFNVDANDPFLSERQRGIAKGLYLFPSIIVHPLTGELLVSTSVELSSMGATGQAIESARTLSLAGGLLKAYGTTQPEILEQANPLVGNVRRGTQQRIDEPQLDEKEWWMINGVLPTFIRTVGNYAIKTSKLPHEFDLGDYARINRWLKNLTDSSQLDNNRQTRKFDHYPMERAIPPVQLLYKEGLLKV